MLTAEYWQAMSQREVLIEIGDLGGLPPTEAREPLRITMDTPVEEAGEGIRARTISSLDVADYLDVRFSQVPKLEQAAG